MPNEDVRFPQTRVLVVDDHSLLREGICAVLRAENDMTVVSEACNGRDRQHYRALSGLLRARDLAAARRNRPYDGRRQRLRQGKNLTRCGGIHAG